MRAGRLKHKIQFLEKTSSTNELGEITNSWNQVYECFCDIFSQSEKEFIKEPLDEFINFNKIKLRYSALVKITQKISYKNKNFKILSLENIGLRDKELRLICKEIKDD